MSKETIKMIQFDTNPAVKSIKDLRKELKEYKDQMANLEEGSDAFLEIANKAGEVKHQIDEINESIKGASADFGDMVGNVSNVAAGFIGAFEAVAGGLQAMGIESEAIDDTIKRMQGLIAVVQGLSAIDDGIKSLDKLAASITSTSKAAKLLKSVLQPKVFLAVGAAVTALSLTFGKLFGNAKKAAEMEKERAEAFKKLKLEEQKKKQEEYNTALERELTLKENIITAKYGDDDVKKIRALIKLYQTELTDLESQLKNKYRDNEELAIKSRIRELNKEINQLDEGSKEYIETLIKITTAEDELKKVKPLTEEEVTNLETRIKDFKQKIKDAEVDLKEAQILKAVNDETKAKAKTREERLKELGLVEFTDEDLKEGKENVKQYWEEIYNVKLEQLKRSKKTQKELIEGEIEIEKQRITLYQEGTLEYEKQLTKIFELEKELSALTDTQYEQMKKAGDAFFDGLKQTVNAFSDSSLGLSSQWISSLDQFQLAFKQTMDIVSKEGKAGWKSYGNVAATALGGIGTLLNAISQDQDVSTKKGFEQQKKLQIAATTMNMLSGIMAAWTSSMALPAPASFIVGGIQTAATAALGAAQIAKIQSQTMNSAMASGAINPTAVNSMVIPPVQYSSAVQGASTEGAIQNTKVYVTESDIASTMNKVSVQETENTY